MRSNLNFAVRLVGLLFGVTIYAAAAQVQVEAQSGNQDLNISAQDLPVLQEQALNGSSEAAHRLCLYFDLVKLDPKAGLFWAQIEAENGGAKGEYNYGFHLLHDPDANNRVRARYWLKLAQKHGHPLAAQLLSEGN